MNIFLKTLAAAIAGLSIASPHLFSLAETIACVGRGNVAQAGLGNSRWSDRLVTIGFHTGGWKLAEIVYGGIIFFPYFGVLCLLFFITTRLQGRTGIIARYITWAICLGITVMGAGQGWLAWQNKIFNLRLLAPIALLEAAQKDGGRVFYNPSTIENIAAFAPGLLDVAISQSRRTELVQSPLLWREQDRTHPASIVIFSSNLSEARPLIEHLLTSPDWHLALVDNQGLLFQKGSGQDFSPPQLEKSEALFEQPRDQALFLAQSAMSFENIGLKAEARVYIDRALEIAPKDFDVLIRAASLSASHGRWARARSLAERALKTNPSSAQGNYLRALALLETGAVDKAFDAAAHLIRIQPEDFGALSLHARIARAAHDYSAEIKSLEKLLNLSKKSGLPPAHLHIYLGQAWAQKGFPDQALEHYRSALQGKLTPGEENDVREAIKTIETNRLPPP